MARKKVTSIETAKGPLLDIVDTPTEPGMDLEVIVGTPGDLVPRAQEFIEFLTNGLSGYGTTKVAEFNAQFEGLERLPVNAETCPQVSKRLAELKDWMSDIDASFKKPTDIANRIHKCMTGARAAILDTAKIVMVATSNNLLKYNLAVREENERRARAAEAERQRLAQEAADKARADAEAERQRLLDEQQARLAEQRAAAEEAAPWDDEPEPVPIPEIALPDPEEAARQAAETALLNAPVALRSAKPEMVGVATRKTPLHAVVCDKIALIKEAAENPEAFAQYLEPVMPLLNALAKQADKEMVYIVPGVRAERGETLGRS